MPIHGITDKLRFPRLGKVRTGEKDRDRGFPRALDHFRMDDARPIAVTLGNDKPKEIGPIRLPTNAVLLGDEWTFNGFWHTARKAYGSGSGLFCSCDETVVADSGNQYLARRQRKGMDDRDEIGRGQAQRKNPNKGKPLDPEGEAFISDNGLEIAVGEHYEFPCPADECSFTRRDQCKPIGLLDFLMPSVPGIGTWCVQSKGFHSIRGITSYLWMLAGMLDGKLTKVDLWLKLTPQNAYPKGQRKIIYVVSIECREKLEDVKSRVPGSTALTVLNRDSEPVEVAPAPASDEEVAPDEFFEDGGAALDDELAEAPFAEGDRIPEEPAAERLRAAAGEEDIPSVQTRVDRLREAAIEGDENAKKAEGRPKQTINRPRRKATPKADDPFLL